MYFALFPRHGLAVIHYNANSGKDKDPDRVMYISYPKYRKGEDTVKSKSQPASFGKFAITYTKSI